MEEKICDIAIIGSGPGGYTAAIRATQLGYKVILIDKLFLGGVCLNTGCIPTKAILTSADVLDRIKKAESFGLFVKDVSFDFSKIIERKDKIVTNLRNGLQSLLISNKIEIIQGKATINDKSTVTIKGQNSYKIIAKNIVIATGSIPTTIANIEIDHKTIFNSNSILALKKLPSSIAIVGGGYIGCEFASFFARLNVKVTIVESLESILFSHGKEVSSLLSKAFLKNNIDLKTNHKLKGIKKNDSGVTLILDDSEIKADIALIAIGRKPNIQDLGLENLKINLGGKNEIIVNEKMQTSIPNIYAVGDVIGKWMLAHAASHEALVAIDTIHGIESKMSYDAIPSIIFTKPEIASVGLTQEGAISKNIEIEIGKFPFTALGKAHALDEKDGFVKVIVDKKSKVILGAQAIGSTASVLIAEMSLAITNKLKIIQLIETIHAHPTLSESWMEAACISQNRSLNFPPNLKI